MVSQLAFVGVFSLINTSEHTQVRSVRDLGNLLKKFKGFLEPKGLIINKVFHHLVQNKFLYNAYRN
jgi:hypothetical protein